MTFCSTNSLLEEDVPLNTDLKKEPGARGPARIGC